MSVTYSGAGGIKCVDSVNIDTCLDRVGTENFSGGIDDQFEGSRRGATEPVRSKGLVHEDGGQGLLAQKTGCS